MFKKFGVYTAIFLFLANAVFAQGAGEKSYTLYYYGVVTNVNDQNMLNITQDLFAAQIRGINYVSLMDRRDDAIKDSYNEISSDTEGAQFFNLVESAYSLQEKSILFYTRIYRAQSDAQWECTFFAKNIVSGVVASQTKIYDSYYRILSDAKSLIQTVVARAGGLASAESGAQQNATREKPKALNFESVAGTWSGEKNISKIILMRSGRGFIVFTNGATMNINISLLDNGDSQKLRIVQQDRFNASFYPDIDRKTILSYADSAAPIEWNMVLTSSGSLEGVKKTLVAKSGGVEPASVNVVWTKK